MNRWKLHRKTNRFVLVFTSLLTLILIVITGVSSYAATPDAAYIHKIEGTGLTIGAGNSRDRTRASEHQQLRMPNQVLYVPGGNKSFAYLGFIFDWVQEHADLLVSAGPSPNPSEWSFPCSARGRFTIAWKEGSKRGCEEGVKVQSSSKRGWLPNNNLQASRRLLAQAEDEVTVVPTPGESIIQTADSAAGISIDVLVGDVRVKSAKNPGGRLVKAGERYNYPQDTITPIDINPIVNSPEMQDFLNPNNWSSPDIPQRVADGIAGQLGEMRTALRNGSPATASNSGNNNPRQSAIPTPSNNGVNLNGEWTFDFGWFSFSSDGSCKAAPEAGAYQGKITITQNGSQLNISPSGPVPMTNGNVSGNQFESRGQTPMRWVGTISSDGKKISGSGICGSVNMPFTMTRQGSQSVASNSSQQPSDLSGTWIARGTGFTGDNKGCFAGYSGRLTVDGQDAAPGNEFTMTQEGNQLRFPTQNVSYSNSTGSGSYTLSSNGTVSGNQVTTTTSGGGFTTRSTGTISNDGNTVTGQSVCQYSGGSATANGSFTWTRKK